MPAEPLILGLETGGSKVRALLVDESMAVLGEAEGRRFPGFAAKETLDCLIKTADAARSRGEARCGDRCSLRAIGWGFGGGVDRETNEPTLNLHEPGWENLFPGRQLLEHFGCPVFLENDCNVAALAEACLGAGSPRGVSIYLTVGSGIGGGVTIDGRLFRASRFGETEVGHLAMDPDGPLCPCGNRGCLEAFSSGDGMAARAREWAFSAGTVGPLAEKIRAASSPAEITPLLFAFYQDDPQAKHLIDDACQKLGIACSMLINLFVPRRIVLGGGVMRQPIMLPAVERAITGHVNRQLRATSSLRLSALGDRVVPLGAAIHARLETGGSLPGSG